MTQYLLAVHGDEAALAAISPEDMNLPGFRLHQLRGDLRGCWAVSVSGNWRITFRFENGEAVDVDYLDYH